VKPHIIALALLATSAASAQSQQDSALVFETVTTSSAKGLPTSLTVRTRTIESAGAIRVETLERSGMKASSFNPFNQEPGSYRITFADGRMISVDTAKREYYEVDVTRMFKKDSPMMKMMASMNAKPSDGKIEVSYKGPGDVILGHKTNQWQTHNVFTMSMVANGDTIAMTTDQFAIVSYADDIRHLVAPSVPGVTPDSEMVATFREFLGADSIATREMRKLPKTLPLRMVTNGSMSMGPIDMSTTVTMNVTRVERVSLDHSMFEIPKGYKKVEMPMMTPPPGM